MAELFRPYLFDLLSIVRRPRALLDWGARRPFLAAVALLVAAALAAAVPLLGAAIERKATTDAALIETDIARQVDEIQKTLLKGVSPTVTRRSGLLGMKKREEANPVFAQKKEQARLAVEAKRAEGARRIAERRARDEHTVRLSWGGAAGLLLLLFLGLVPSIASSGRAGGKGGEPRKKKGAAPDATAIMEFSADAPDAAIGPEGRYLVREMIGRGTMGVVYRAWDKALEREVAVKEMPKPLTGDTEAYQRFRREALTLARLSHPHIVQVFDLFEKEGRAFLAMEYMGGGTLSQLVENEGKLDLRLVGGFAGSVFDALTYLHGQGVIHRDLKPGNILLNERRVPKISDFGLARWDRQNDLTRDGALLGSPNYMSPEQVAGKKADRRSDLYSFGALLYWMAAGVPPFTGEVESVLALHLTRLPSPPSSKNPKVPRQLDSLIMSLMAKDPADREQDIDKIRKVLAALAAGK